MRCSYSVIVQFAGCGSTPPLFLWTKGEDGFTLRHGVPTGFSTSWASHTRWCILFSVSLPTIGSLPRSTSHDCCILLSRKASFSSARPTDDAFISFPQMFETLSAREDGCIFLTFVIFCGNYPPRQDGCDPLLWRWSTIVHQQEDVRILLQFDRERRLFCESSSLVHAVKSYYFERSLSRGVMLSILSWPDRIGPNPLP